MPWTESDYPDSMKRLPARVREKAIEIANALLEEKNMKEETLIATAISNAKDWGVNNGIKTENKKSETYSNLHEQSHRKNPYKQERGAKREGKQKAKKVFYSKYPSVNQPNATKKANTSGSNQHKKGTVDNKLSHNSYKRTGR